MARRKQCQSLGMVYARSGTSHKGIHPPHKLQNFYVKSCSSFLLQGVRTEHLNKYNNLIIISDAIFSNAEILIKPLKHAVRLSNIH